MRYTNGMNHALIELIDAYTPYLAEHYGEFYNLFDNSLLMSYTQKITALYKRQSINDSTERISVNTISYNSSDECEKDLDELLKQLYIVMQDIPDESPMDWLNNAGYWNINFKALYLKNRFIFNTLAYDSQLIILYDIHKRYKLIDLIKILVNTTNIIVKDNYCYAYNDETKSKVIYIYDKVDIKEFEELIGIKLICNDDRTPADKIRTDLLINLVSDLYNTDCSCDNLLSQYYNTLTQRTQLINNINAIDNSLSNIDTLFSSITKTGGSYHFNEHNDLIITLRTELFNYDETLVNKIYERNGFLEKYGELSNWIIKKCFIENELALLTQTTIKIDFRNFKINAYGDWDSWHNQKIPYNPHIGRYNCFGQNGPELVNLLQQGRWEEFIYCLKATLGNINFNDTTVCDAYFDDMMSETEGTYIWAINKSTGEELTFDELFEMREKEIYNEEN